MGEALMTAPTPADLAAEAKRLATELAEARSALDSLTRATAPNAFPLLDAAMRKFAATKIKLNTAIDALAATREPEGKMDQAVAPCASGVAPVLRMADGTPLSEYLANAEPEDTDMDDWTRGYEECKRRLHRIIGPQLAATSVASDRDSMVPSPSAQPAEPKER